MAEYIDADPRDYHAVDWLDKLGLSAHCLVTPSGVIIKTRSDEQIAYHAKGFNNHSLGIEFLVPGVHTYATFLQEIKIPYVTDEQYNAGLDQVRDWVSRYGITKIFRHSDLDPARKKDPGDGFPWSKFMEDL
ncbi:MAG: hypothetical protein GWN13_02855 [Phycisphaerae bacterium]|nr:hypothetical protein [Phycisphaerae bacterium]